MLDTREILAEPPYSAVGPGAASARASAAKRAPRAPAARAALPLGVPAWAALALGAPAWAALVFAAPASAGEIETIPLDQAFQQLTAAQTGAGFGRAIAAAPGFRGTAAAPLVVGAELWDGAGEDTGLAASFAPRATPGEWDALTADFLMHTTETGARLGASIAAGGDLNDDGITDLAVGAWSADVGGMFDVGSVYVVFGAVSLPDSSAVPDSADLVIVGEAGTDHFGFSLSLAGDLNGDGVRDLVVGSPLGQGTGVSNGEVFVFFGGKHLVTGTMLATADADVHIRGSDSDAGVGSALAVGTFNGDAFDDLVIGSPSASPTSRFHAGAVHVFLGRDFAKGASFVVEDDYDMEIQGSFDTEATGTSLALTDLDGDGLGEILVGAPFAEAGSDDLAGRVYIFTGSEISVGEGLSINASDALRAIEGDEPGDLFGWSIADAGDVDGDGGPDILIGAPGADPEGNAGAGIAFLRLSVAGTLPATGRASDVMDRAYVGVNPGDEAGATIAGIFDFNGDTTLDFAIGAPGYDPSGFSSAGGVFIFTGTTTVDVPAVLGDTPRILASVSPNPTAGPLRVRLAVPGTDGLRAWISDASGRRVRSLARTGDSAELYWDARDEMGHEVGSGVYFLTVDGPTGRDRARIVVTR